MRGRRLRAVLEGLGALLCAAMLVTAFVLAAVAEPPRTRTTGRELDLTGLLPPGPETDPGVRALPLLDPDGPVVATFPGGAGLEDPALVQTVLHTLASRLGLDGVIDTLLTTSLDDPNGGSEDDLDLYHGYPYNYVTLDPLVDGWLTPDAVRADPEALLDLSGLLLLDATRSERVSESDYTQTANSWAGVAYSLLRRARDVAPVSCDVQLQLTFVLSMGYAPHIHDVEAESRRAVAACPDDPTPLWLLGQVQSGQASLIESFVTYELGPRAMARAAEATFAKLREQYPDSPLGWAGAADLHLQLADEAGELGWEPFQVRSWQRSALQEYAEARRRSEDPALLVGWGRALSANGRDDDAVDALHDAYDRLPWQPAYETVLLTALERAGRPAEVATTIEESPPLTHPLMDSLSLSLRRVGVGEPATANYGFGGSRAGVVFDQSRQYAAGSSVQDLGFVPTSNGTWTGSWCRAATYLTALIEDHRAGEAWQLVSHGLDPESWDGTSVDCHGGPLLVDTNGQQPGFTDSTTALGRIGLVAALETGDLGIRADALSRSDDGTTSAQALLSQAMDADSDFWRAAGDMARAQGVVDDWQTQLPQDPWAWHRAGELAFLDGDYPKAADDYQQSVALFVPGEQLDAAYGDHGLGSAVVDDNEGRASSELELGAAQELAGDPDTAAATYRSVVRELSGLPYSEYRDELTFYTRSQLGSLELARGDLDEAAQQLSDALDQDYPHGPPGPADEIGWAGQSGRLSSGAQDNNLALALAKLGRGVDSVTYAESALAHDPANPVYVDTVAFAEDLAGHAHAAAVTYRAALVADPTSYVSANNLAVLLAQRGHRTDAAAVLEDALDAAPDYAIGWHNLGVVQASASRELLPSQGALARAASLDHHLRGRDDLIVDAQIYRSGLDVSKPLPPDWTYAASASGSTGRLTLSVILLLLLRVVWVLGLDKVVSAVAERLVRHPGEAAVRRRTWFWRRLAPVWAVLACLGVVGWPLYQAGHSALERGVLAGSGAALVLLPLLLRRVLAAGSHAGLRHHTWTPAVALGVVAAPFGLTLAPYPFMEADAPRSGRLRAVVPLVMAPVALAFLALAWLDPTPLAHTLAVSSFALLGSVLAPVPPLDASHFRSRMLNLVVTLGLAGATAAFALSWV